MPVTSLKVGLVPVSVQPARCRLRRPRHPSRLKGQCNWPARGCGTTTIWCMTATKSSSASGPVICERPPPAKGLRDDRGMFPTRHGGAWPGPLRSASLARLASPYDAVHGFWRLSGRIAGRAPTRRQRQTETNESDALRLTPIRPGLPSVPKIRCPIAKLLPRPPMPIRFVLAWSVWRQRHQLGAAEPHYRAHKTQL